MADKFTLKTSSNDGRVLRLVCEQTSNGSVENSSTIKWTLYSEGGNSSYYSTGPTKVIINDTTVYTKSRVAWDSYKFPASKGSVNGELIVKHGSDGTKSINVSLSTAIQTSEVSTYSDTWELDSIPRYANYTSFSMGNTTETSVTVNWNADAECDLVAYLIKGTEWVYLSPKKSFVIDGLSPNTEYDIMISIRRTDSQLWTHNGYWKVTTYDYPKPIAMNNFVIGDGAEINVYNPLKRTYTLQLLSRENWAMIGTYTGTKNGVINAEFKTAEAIERQYGSIPNKASGVYMAVVTCGNVERTLDIGATYTIKGDENPIFTDFEYADTNPVTCAVTGNNQALISGLSTLTVKIDSNNKMEARCGATPDRYVFNIDILSDSLPYSTGNIEKSFSNTAYVGAKRLSVWAYDKRGLSTLVYKDITAYEYAKPVINASVTRLNNFEAQTTIKVSGTYTLLNIDGTDKNYITETQYRYRETGGEWCDWIDIPTTLNAGEFACSDVIISLDNTKSFEVEIKAKDRLSEHSLTVPVDVGQAIFFISTNKKECYINSKRVLHDSIMVSEAGTDLNDYLTTGVYFFGGDYTPLNIPAGANGWLEVIGSTDNRVKQTWYRCGTITTNDFMTYTRTYIAGTWGEWHRYATLTTELYNASSHIADYIIEQGTSGIWTYEKWASGKAVCWGSLNKTLNITTDWAVTHFYGTVPSQAFVENLFKERPKIWVSAEESGGNIFAIKTVATKNNTGAIYCVSPVSLTNVNVYVDIEAKGKWK